MGPLAGLRIVEIAGIGPGPYCAMLLADMGAEVLRVERPAKLGARRRALRPALARAALHRVDLKQPAGIAAVLRLVERADGLTEGFRPGVMERLGLGPDVCLARNPRLVYGRMTGFGQTGPLAQAAGHDINYIALAGALGPIGRRGAAPTPPLNLVGDFGGGGLLLAFGMTCALLERARSGKGQVVDAAMVDGAAALMTVFHGAQQSGFWSEERGTNMLDTGAHFYDAYETADGEFVSIGAIEPQFYAELLKRAGIDADSLPGAARPRALAGGEGVARAAVQDEDARRVVRAARGQRRVLRAGALHVGGAPPPAQRRARPVRRGRRRRAAATGAALQPHGLRDPARARARGGAHGRGPARLGLLGRRACSPAPERGRRLTRRLATS